MWTRRPKAPAYNNEALMRPNEECRDLGCAMSLSWDYTDSTASAPEARSLIVLPSGVLKECAPFTPSCISGSARGIHPGNCHCCGRKLLQQAPRTAHKTLLLSHPFAL